MPIEDNFPPETKDNTSLRGPVNPNRNRTYEDEIGTEVRNTTSDSYDAVKFGNDCGNSDPRLD